MSNNLSNQIEAIYLQLITNKYKENDTPIIKLQGLLKEECKTSPDNINYRLLLAVLYNTDTFFGEFEEVLNLLEGINDSRAICLKYYFKSCFSQISEVNELKSDTFIKETNKEELSVLYYFESLNYSYKDENKINCLNISLRYCNYNLSTLQDIFLYNKKKKIDNDEILLQYFYNTISLINIVHKYECFNVPLFFQSFLYSKLLCLNVTEEFIKDTMLTYDIEMILKMSIRK
ncbi:MAG: hypothetical protein U0U67_03075 [Chitinophagales bacterium]